MLATLLCTAVSTDGCVTGAGGVLRALQGQRDVSRGVLMRLRLVVRVYRNENSNGQRRHLNSGNKQRGVCRQCRGNNRW